MPALPFLTLPFLQTLNPQTFPNLSSELEFLIARVQLGSYFETQFGNLISEGQRGSVWTQQNAIQSFIRDTLAGPILQQLAAIASKPAPQLVLELGPLIEQLSAIRATLIGNAARDPLTLHDHITDLAEEAKRANILTAEFINPIALDMRDSLRVLSSGSGGRPVEPALIQLVTSSGFLPRLPSGFPVPLGPTDFLGMVVGHGLDKAAAGTKQLSETLWPELLRIITPLLLLLQQGGTLLLGKVQEVATQTFGAAGETIIAAVDDRLAAVGTIEPGQQGAIVRELLGQALTLGIGAHLVAAGAEAVFPFKPLGLPQLAALMVDLAGFAEVAKAEHSPKIAAGIGKPAQLQWNEVFQSSIPDQGFAMEMAAKRDLPLADFEQVLRWNGQPAWSRAAILKTMWTDPRLNEIARLTDDSPIDDVWIRSKLEQAGLEDADVDRALVQIQRNSVRTLRGSFLNSLTIAFRDGLLTETELDSELALLGMREDARRLVLLRARLELRRELVQEQETTWRTMVEQGVLPIEDYRASLAMLGMAPERVEVLTARLDAKRRGKILREEEARVSAALRQEQIARVTAAREAFQRELLDAETFRSLLLGLDLTEAHAAAIVSLEQLRKTPAPRRPPLLTAAAQRELENQVIEEAVLDAYTKALTSEDTARTALISLGIPEREREAKLALARIRRTPRPPTIIREPPGVARARQLNTDAAILEFRNGRLSENGLRARLLALGHEAALVDALIDREQARQHPASASAPAGTA